MPTNSRPSSRSRDMVQVLLRDRRSMRRSVSALKRTSAVSETYSTFAVSPSTAAATAFSQPLDGGNINAYRYGGDFLNTGSRHEHEGLAHRQCTIVYGRFAGNFAASPAAVGA